MKKRDIFFVKNKKGSHIGVVLSFIIFVIFLVFLYSTLEPLIKVDENKEFIAGYLEKALIEKISTNLTTLTITIGGTVNQNCIILDNLIDGTKLSSKVIVKDYYKNIIPSYISDTSNSDLIVDRESVGDTFLKIYGSEGFENLDGRSTTGCQLLGTEYTIKLLKSSEYISQAKTEELKNDYSGEYESLKEELNIPEENDFGFGFIYNDGSKIETESENVTGDVYVEEIPVRYIDNEANILSGFIIIKIW